MRLLRKLYSYQDDFFEDYIQEVLESDTVVDDMNDIFSNLSGSVKFGIKNFLNEHTGDLKKSILKFEEKSGGILKEYRISSSEFNKRYRISRVDLVSGGSKGAEILIEVKITGNYKGVSGFWEVPVVINNIGKSEIKEKEISYNK